ncbi:hypothetical protein [Nannocystis sp. SCPEA4]|uniref:hypothetical protein n=1 Tax=Nannocystis sp. SCPEA4 TaxID=2996787 RepID=UPI00226FC24C|nr:hypothetical protein [Nannocystis sp. SCPEA4]MCY1061009.1 hypothetical protein [Nannocystis sp. SCPEA4]
MKAFKEISPLRLAFMLVAACGDDNAGSPTTNSSLATGTETDTAPGPTAGETSTTHAGSDASTNDTSEPTPTTDGTTSTTEGVACPPNVLDGDFTGSRGSFG